MSNLDYGNGNVIPKPWPGSKAEIEGVLYTVVKVSPAGRKLLLTRDSDGKSKSVTRMSCKIPPELGPSDCEPHYLTKGRRWVSLI